jgi:hypothetical protein
VSERRVLGAGTEGEHQSEPWTGYFRAFVETCKRWVRNEVRALRDPRDDIHPALIMHRGDRLRVQRIPGRWLANAATKQAVIEQFVLPIIRAGRPSKLAIVSAAWTCEPGSPLADYIDAFAARGAPIPRFDEVGLPGLLEEVYVSAFDPERHEFWRALKRSAGCLAFLGPWTMPGGARDVMAGPWVDPIREAMR